MRHFTPPLLLAALLLPLLSAAEVERPTTPQEVWAGFDPRAELLEIDILKTWSEDGVAFRELRFTAMTEGKSRVRAYAVFSAPQGGKNLPGVLHVHGGGQSVSPPWLRYWPGRGYACLSFDWGGRWAGREHFTDWGDLKQGNAADAGKRLQAVEPSVRSSSWYLWARVSRRALSVLEKQEEVDPKRLGVFGVSVGGTLAWPLAATDDRIRAACAVYGVGWNTYPADRTAPDPDADKPDVKLWRATMEAEAYAPRVRCPMLFLNSTNDHHGNMDRSFDTLDRVKAPLRFATTPRFRHHIAAEEARDLPLWMDAWLKDGAALPQTPTAAVSVGKDGVPRLVVTPDRADDVQRVDAFYAVENRVAVNRFWRSAEPARDGDTWTAAMPLLDVNQPLFAFANVHYRSGVVLSTRMQTVDPSKLPGVKATDQTSDGIDDFADGVGGWVTASPGTDPVPPLRKLLKAVKGPDGRPGIAVSQPVSLFTHKVGDPKWRGPDGASLLFQVHVRSEKELRVTVHENEFVPGHRQYVAVVPLKPGEGWRTVTLSVKDFRDAKGELPGGWGAVKMLELETSGGPGAEPIYGRFRWVR